MGVYANNAMTILSHGLFPLPMSTGSIKRPRIRWKHFVTLPQQELIQSFMNQFSASNIGTLTGPITNLTVVDVDDPSLVYDAVQTFGETPLGVKTPSGGCHMYYRYNGESTMTRWNSLAIDIRAKGGIIMLPPSVNTVNGESYRFISGDLSLLDSLPTINSDVLGVGQRQSRSRPESSSNASEEGSRNVRLFNMLRSHAHSVDSEEALLSYAILCNSEDFDVPLKEREVEDTVKSVWDYKVKGTLLLPGSQYIPVTLQEYQDLLEYPKALTLLLCIKLYQQGLRDEFVVSPTGLEKLLPYSAKTIRSARDVLIEHGYLIQTYSGGNGAGDPHLFTFNQFNPHDQS